MKGVNVEVTMKRTLYLDLPDDASEESILENAKKEIILPIEALNYASQILRQTKININKLDLKDWEESNINYKVINENT